MEKAKPEKPKGEEMRLEDAVSAEKPFLPENRLNLDLNGDLASQAAEAKAEEGHLVQLCRDGLIENLNQTGLRVKQKVAH